MPAKRRGLSSNGLDGLDAVIPPRSAPDPTDTSGNTNQPTGDTPTAGASADGRAGGAGGTPAPPKAVKFSSYLPPDVVDQLRNALFFLGGDWTTGALLEQALTRELDHLAAEYNDGNPFPPRSTTRLRPGSRIRRD